jgi:hypothetical protein
MASAAPLAQQMPRVEPPLEVLESQPCRRPSYAKASEGTLLRATQYRPCVARSAQQGGGDEGDRTLDLRIANATLSQLSYVPTRRHFTERNGPRPRGAVKG